MYHPPHRLGQLNYTCSTKSQIQNPKSRIQHPKSNIQNPKSESKIQNSCHPAAQIDARLVEIRSRCAELACIASRMQKSRIQNPESRIQNPDAGGRFRRIIPGDPRCAELRSSPSQLRRPPEFCARRAEQESDPSEFCSGLRRIRDCRFRIQNPESQPLRRRTDFDFAQESKIHIPGPVCSARVPSRILGARTVTIQNFEGT